jgi:apolipoprotein N-acyltransferase
VVWPEVAAWVEPDMEAGVAARGKALAAEHDIHLVLSYIVPRQRDPLLVENKYVWVEPNGAVHTYLKHKPLPFEPSVPGDGVPRIVNTRFGKASGAICWDADFPHIARRHATAGSVLMVLPSADTPGVDPFHTQIAQVRAIEGGYSILRATRNGLSAGIGPRGIVRGRLSANESNDDILVVSLPTCRVPTLYSRTGDLLVWLSLIGALVLAAVGMISTQNRSTRISVMQV